MVEWLRKKPLLHAMMIESIRRGSGERVKALPDGVLVHDRACGAQMVSAGSARTADVLFDSLVPSDMLVTHDGYTRELALTRFPYKDHMVCVQAVYTKPAIALLPADIRPLDARHFDSVRAQYGGVDDDGYVMERLNAGAICGIFEDGALAGFMGTHREGSLGMLEILPKYRRRGLAEALERHVVREHLARGWTPFAQIEVGNFPSIALHEKLGFEVSDEPFDWFY
ncbi:MAG: GNAT family N-acetyltransferase [Christensenellales bacterium]|jgi:tRNA (guanine37-N1)-methyltransferase